MEPHGMLYEDLTNYSSLTLESGMDQSVFLCHGDLCCSLNYSISCSTNQLCDNYRLLSYSGFRTLGGGLYTVYIQVCHFKYLDVQHKIQINGNIKIVIGE